MFSSPRTGGTSGRRGQGSLAPGRPEPVETCPKVGHLLVPHTNGVNVSVVTAEGETRGRPLHGPLPSLVVGLAVGGHSLGLDGQETSDTVPHQGAPVTLPCLPPKMNRGLRGGRRLQPPSRPTGGTGEREGRGTGEREGRGTVLTVIVVILIQTLTGSSITTVVTVADQDTEPLLSTNP